MRPHRLLGFPLDRPWLMASGGFSTRTFDDFQLGSNVSRLASSLSLQEKWYWKEVEALTQWWVSRAAGLKQLYTRGAGGPKMPHPSTAGVANIPAMMNKYYVALAESMGNVRCEFAQSMIADLWDMVPSITSKTFLIAENETLWSRTPTSRLYEQGVAAFTHPVGLAGTARQEMLDQYLLQHLDDF
ncbi:unnamed protein product [Effrenium voratum]|nr:unnamed protein product [Effrenium voratum]